MSSKRQFEQETIENFSKKVKWDRANMLKGTIRQSPLLRDHIKMTGPLAHPTSLKYFWQIAELIQRYRNDGILVPLLKLDSFRIVTIDGKDKLAISTRIAIKSTKKFHERDIFSDLKGYIPPEYFRDKLLSIEMVNLWCLGIIGHELFTGSFPFDFGSKYVFTLDRLRPINPEISEIIIDLLNQDPLKRPSLDELCARLKSLL